MQSCQWAHGSAADEMRVRADLLRETIECVHGENSMLANALLKILHGSPIGRPPVANDGYKDYYWLELSVEQISEIVSILLQFEVNSVGHDGTTTPAASHYAGLVDFWSTALTDIN